jgi:membrane protein implicated in regulation of membrane protease activity
MIGRRAIVKTPLDPVGIVLADGTRWEATLETGRADLGEQVEITAVNGLKLTVRKK